jgi:integrase
MQPHTHYLTKRKKVYYYQRRVPSCLVKKYSKTKIFFSLRTRNLSTAKRKAYAITHRLNSVWEPAILEQSYLHAVLNEVQPHTCLDQSAKDYIKHKELQLTKGAQSTLNSQFRNLRLVIGNKPLQEISSDDIHDLFNYLHKEKKLELSTIANHFTNYRALYNYTSELHGFKTLNPFANIKIPKHSTCRSKRLPFNTDELIQIVSNLNLHIIEHQAIGLMINTGMRLSETCGLSTSELHINEPIPYIHLKPTTIRRLKTPNSSRKIPLVGISLEAACKAMQHSSNEQLFPNWIGSRSIPKSVVMNGINNEIKSLSQTNKTSHCFRHSLRDRLREIDCPSELIDSIGGWAYGNVGQQYGEGYSLRKKKEWLNKINVFTD